MMTIEGPISLTAEMIEQLMAEKSRTQIGHIKLFETRIIRDPDRPQNLSIREICRWISRAETEALPSHFDYVLSQYRKLPSKTNSARKRTHYVPLTEDSINKLISEIDRTQVTPRSLFLHRCRHDPARPKDLNEHKINKWVNGRARTADPELLDYVMAAYKKLDTNAAHKIDFDAEMLERLKDERARTQAGGQAIVNAALRAEMPLPSGLTAHTINGWTGRSPKKIRGDHFAFVIRILEALPSHIDRSSTRGASSSGGVDMEEIDYLKRVVLAD